MPKVQPEFKIYYFPIGCFCLKWLLIRSNFMIGQLIEFQRIGASSNFIGSSSNIIGARANKIGALENTIKAIFSCSKLTSMFLLNRCVSIQKPVCFIENQFVFIIVFLFLLDQTQLATGLPAKRKKHAKKQKQYSNKTNMF